MHSDEMENVAWLQAETIKKCQVHVKNDHLIIVSMKQVVDVYNKTGFQTYLACVIDKLSLLSL